MRTGDTAAATGELIVRLQHPLGSFKFATQVRFNESVIRGIQPQTLLARQRGLGMQKLAHDLKNVLWVFIESIGGQLLAGRQRQVGKVQELGLGYEGGVAAFLTFAAVYGMDLATGTLGPIVRNTGGTLAKCAALVAEAGGTVIATLQIYDRLEALVDLGVPKIALAEFKAPPNHRADACPMCAAHEPITSF